MGDAETAFVLPVLKRLREAGVPAEIYADAAKFKKQMSYANDRAIPYVAIVGESELLNGVIALKDMTSGEQQNLTPDELISKFVK
jgi:histidyl-tRNA synthetase